MLLTFPSSNQSSLKSIEMAVSKEAPIESYVSFNVNEAGKSITTWSLEIKDKNGKIKNFGPYTEQTVKIPGASILENSTEDDFEVTMVAKTASGETIKKSYPLHVVLWTPSTSEDATRFSVLYEFNESKVIGIYEKYISNIIAPKVTWLHGYYSWAHRYNRR